MKIAYICADPGIPVLGNKGASVHVREFTGALAALGHQVRIYSAAGAAANTPGEKLNATRAGLTVLAPAEHIKDRARLAAANLARLESQREHVHLFSEFLHLLADPEFVQAARPLLQGFGPDLIIARHALFSTAGATLARALECPYILEVNAPL